MSSSFPIILLISNQSQEISFFSYQELVYYWQEIFGKLEAQYSGRYHFIQLRDEFLSWSTFGYGSVLH